MEQPYTRINNSEAERRAPPGKYRVLLSDRSDDRGLYFVSDHDNAEEAIKVAESLRNKDGNPQGGIVGDSKGWDIYPWFDGHQLHTSEELLATYGHSNREHGTRPMTSRDIRAIKAKQAKRIPGWKPGDRLVVFWQDIEDATGAKAHCGDF